MPVTLLPISLAELQQIAVAHSPLEITMEIADEALPPPFVAKRAAALLEQGKSAFWCSTFYIVRKSDNLIVGGCGYKSEPENGVVEIGYAIAPSCQGQGLATAAIRLLLQLGFETKEITHVLAQILPHNLASARVVEKLGFTAKETVLDKGNELVVQWWAQNVASGEDANLIYRAVPQGLV